MVTKRIFARVLAGVMAVAGAASAQAPRVEDVLARVPSQPGVTVTNPTGADLANCKAEAVTWNGGAKGVVVKDAGGKLVRQFIDTTGGTKPNIFSYYLDGVEAYREIDSNANGKPDQFRWLGANGGKWGADPQETGTISKWYVLSPEELSQELLAAVIGNDRKRLEALLPTDADLSALKLPQADAAQILKRAGGAAANVTATNAALKLTPKAKWIHLQLGVPHTTPKDAFGGADDLVKHKTAAVLIETEDKKAEVFQTGELMLVGRAWKVVEGPGVGAPGIAEDPKAAAIPKVIEADVKALGEIKPPAANSPTDSAKYHLDRAVVLEQIVTKTTGAQQYLWLRQLIEAYAAAAEVNPTDAAAMGKLKAWRDQIGKTEGATDAASFVNFRMLNAEYGAKLAAAAASKNNDEALKVQTWWREQMEAFVKAFPKTAEAPEAVQRLALAFDVGGAEGEAKAKEWYEKLAKDYPMHPLAAKAAGAVKRLGSEGTPFALSGTTLEGKPFTEAQIAGAPTVVIYWASWGRDAADELGKLAELQKTLGKVNVVTVSLDDDAATAVKTLQAAKLPGYHLHAAGGLDGSPLAVAYGIQMVPHIMVVGKDGKVSNRNAQSGAALKNELEKLLK